MSTRHGSDAERASPGPRTRTLRIGGLRYRIHEWGPRDAPPLLLLHGWMDSGISFRFFVDALGPDRRCLAPDWRGFGGSDRAPGGYWFADYLADLDALLDALAPEQPVSLLGHSMGGNVAGLYAGVRPQRVRHLISVEGFGLAPSEAQEAPQRYAQWLDSLREPLRPRRFDDYTALAERLMRRHPLLGRDRAVALARDAAYAKPDGVYLRGDPAHQRPNPVLYRLEEAMACWRCTTASVLWVYGRRSAYMARLRALGDWAQRRACFRDFREAAIAESGHAVHYEQPRALAEVVASFLRGH